MNPNFKSLLNTKGNYLLKRSVFMIQDCKSKLRVMQTVTVKYIFQFLFCYADLATPPKSIFLLPSSQLGCEVTDAQTFMQSFIFSFGWYDLHCLGCNHQLRSQSCVYLHNIQYVCHSEPFIVFREGARCVSFCRLFKTQPQQTRL